VSWEHVKAFLWLRWRLAVNQMRRSGPGGSVVAVLFTALMVAGGVVGLLAGALVGFLPLRDAPPRVVMAIWDVAIVGFVFFWIVGLIAELQHSDALSLDRFLHLPVSPSGAFLINYIGSSVSLSLVVFLPAMLGLAFGLTVSRGPGMLPLFPLVAAFFVMMTAVTHQFRGWLASMMTNPRRRRTIIAVVPLLFVMAFQIQPMWSTFGPGARERRAAREESRRVRRELDEDLAAGRITKEEYDRRRPAPPDSDPDAGYDAARRANMVLPPGWLAYGAEAAAEGRTWPPLAGIAGMALIGVVSLRRSYGTTLRLYRGDFDRTRRATASPAAADSTRTSEAPSAGGGTLLERQLPWTSDPVAAVALAGFRSALRAPEVKMSLLMTPVFMLVVFTGMFSRSDGLHELLKPMQAAGLAAFVMVIGMLGPAGNQFGFDRGAFRAFVLSPIRRRDILVGKNLGLLPLAVPTMLVIIGVTQWFSPMRLDHLAGVLIQIVPIYLLFCLAANLLSILGPMTLKPGSGMPARHQGLRSFYPLIFMLLIPVPLGLTFLPLGVEALLSLTETSRFPAYLALGLVQALATVALYRVAVRWQGGLLQDREQEILEIVAARAE
jgi:hypothetical protein